MIIRDPPSYFQLAQTPRECDLNSGGFQGLMIYRNIGCLWETSLTQVNQLTLHCIILLPFLVLISQLNRIQRFDNIFSFWEDSEFTILLYLLKPYLFIERIYVRYCERSQLIWEADTHTDRHTHISFKHLLLPVTLSNVNICIWILNMWFVTEISNNQIWVLFKKQNKTKQSS